MAKNTKIEIKRVISAQENGMMPYEILGIKKDATLEEARTAYKKLSLVVHPDRVDEEEKEDAHKAFKSLADAYSRFSKKETNRIYTNTLQERKNETLAKLENGDFSLCKERYGYEQIMSVEELKNLAKANNIAETQLYSDIRGLLQEYDNSSNRLGRYSVALRISGKIGGKASGAILKFKNDMYKLLSPVIKEYENEFGITEFPKKYIEDPSLFDEPANTPESNEPVITPGSNDKPSWAKEKLATLMLKDSEEGDRRVDEHKEDVSKDNHFIVKAKR